MNLLQCDIDEYQEHCDNYDGICVHCRKWSCGGVEPDAFGYECGYCCKKGVMGAENALLLAVLYIDEDEDLDYNS